MAVMSGTGGLMGGVEATEAQIIQRRRSRITTLQSEIDRCDTRVVVVRDMQAKYREELAELLQEEACRPNKSVPVATPDGSDVVEPSEGFEVFRRPRPQVKLVPDAQARDAARTLGTFTDVELAAVAGVTVREAKKAIASFLERGIIAACNYRFKGREMYEYGRPTDTGVAFEVEQQSRVPLSGVAAMLSPSHGGNGHSGPVPYTGKPVGASGKPGRDREKARQGRRIKTKHGKA